MFMIAICNIYQLIVWSLNMPPGCNWPFSISPSPPVTLKTAYVLENELVIRIGKNCSGGVP
jgi:hypothetical protein